jgi:hypothetical protein
MLGRMNVVMIAACATISGCTLHVDAAPVPTASGGSLAPGTQGSTPPSSMPSAQPTGAPSAGVGALGIHIEAPTPDGWIIGVGSSLALRATSTRGTVVWSVDETDKAHVDQNGLVQALKPGAVHVHATVEGHDAKALLAVTAVPVPATEVTLNGDLPADAIPNNAVVVTTQADWTALWGASPAPTAPVDFSRNSLLVYKYWTVGIITGPQIITDVDTVASPNVITQVRTGASDYGTQPGVTPHTGIGVSPINRRTYFQIPKVGKDATIKFVSPLTP